MQSLFLEGLKTARELFLDDQLHQKALIQQGVAPHAVHSNYLAGLDSLIAEHESGMIETTSVRPDSETR